MRIAPVTALIAFLLFALRAQAGIVIGLVGTEPGVPVSGEEDLVVYNNTGPVDGCSTPGGAPICTQVTFDNVVLTVNGTTELHLGDIAPGFEESLTQSGSVFLDGSITSLSLALSLSTTSLVSDQNQKYQVDSDISLSALPTDGTLTFIEASSSVPEPGPVWLVGGGLVSAIVWKNLMRKRNPRTLNWDT